MASCSGTERVSTRSEILREPFQLFCGLKRASASLKELQWINGGLHLLRVQGKLKTSALNIRTLYGDFFTHKIGSNDAMDRQESGTQKDFQVPALVDAIKACGRECNVAKGSSLHAHLLKTGLLTKNIYIGTALLCMYAKCGALTKAQEVFNELTTRDVAAWNALISAYVQHGLGHEALACFANMCDEGHIPDAVTFVCILKACASIGAAEKGEEIHAEVRRQGLLEMNMVLGTALLDMYGKCGVLARAQEVFNELPVQDVVSWNALIGGYAQHGFSAEALNCYSRMRNKGLSPNAITFTCVLKACGIIRAADIGEEIHAEVHKQGLLERNTVLGTALVDMYAKCGALTKAREVFDALLFRDVASWNALISGYAQNDLGDEAVDLFGQMQHDNHLSPNTITFLCILKACGSIGASEKGSTIHVEVTKQRLLENSVELGNTLIDMYAKCGLLAKAQDVFDRLPARTIVSWNVLIAAYAQLGKVEMVVHLFSRLVGENLEPNEITFNILLSVCSHAGLVDKGQMYFNILNTEYGIIPTLDLHACMIDLLSRAGRFEKAISVIHEVPTPDSLILCSVLLGSCQKWVNLELAQWVFEHAVHLDDRFSAGYIYLSNIYADVGMQEEVGKFEAFESDD